MNTEKQKNIWLDLLWLSISIAVIFAFMLGCRALSVPDESRYTEIPREMLLFHDFITPHLNSVIYFEKPPLLYWMQALMINWFGINEWALRAPTALMALIGCLAVYLAGRKLFDRSAGIIAAVILALSPLYFVMGHSITLDMTVSVWLTIALLSFISAVDLPYPSTQRRNLMWLMYAAAAMAMMTKGLIGVAFPGMIIFSWMLLMNQWRQLKQVYLGSGIIIFLIIVLPWHILVQLRNPEFFDFYFIQQHFVRFLTKDMGRYKPMWWFIPILIAGFFPWIVFLLQAFVSGCKTTWQKRVQQSNAIFLAIWAIEIFIFFSISDSKLIPYIVPVFPPIALLVGKYLAEQINAAEIKKTPWIIIAFMAFVFSIAAMTAGHWHHLEVEALQKLMIVAVMLAVFGLGIIILLAIKTNIKKLIVWTSVLQVLFLWSIVAAAPEVDKRPIKPLALKINQLIQPHDIVASFGLYYQDLPVYTQRIVKIVGWRNELTFGYQHQASAKEVLIDYNQFWKLWQGPARVFAVMDSSDYQTYAPKYHMYVIARHDNDYLVSNR